jgi:hypothetical protein
LSRQTQVARRRQRILSYHRDVPKEGGGGPAGGGEGGGKGGGGTVGGDGGDGGDTTGQEVSQVGQADGTFNQPTGISDADEWGDEHGTPVEFRADLSESTIGGPGEDIGREAAEQEQEQQSLPDKVKEVLDHIERKGSPPHGYRGAALSATTAEPDLRFCPTSTRAANGPRIPNGTSIRTCGGRRGVTNGSSSEVTAPYTTPTIITYPL